ncbi:hypothetical protein BV210_04990 [Halorientalis sp. IM1011]|nr:hypothetical protein BV210_04990 [Halorientalis sp. IM1011]
MQIRLMMSFFSNFNRFWVVTLIRFRRRKLDQFLVKCCQRLLININTERLVTSRQRVEQRLRDECKIELILRCSALRLVSDIYFQAVELWRIRIESRQ